MRNLKRVLSLALAAMMLMGVMVVGASAASKDFTDAGEIDNVEAVDVMVALGILEGTDKGDFQPDGILTREQAAKIICCLLMGPEAAEKLTTTGVTFSDVAADRWSAPYIAYCVNMGILAGDGTGKFNPEDKLTGVAFAKMLLVALGYDASIEKYVGDSWAVNVATGAIDAKILPSGLILANELSRQDAAQMGLLTLQGDMVKYSDKGTNIDLGNGIVISGNASDATKTGETFMAKYFADLTKGTGTDDFGRVGTKWTYDGDEVGVYASAADYSFILDDDYTSTEVLAMLKELADDDDLALASKVEYAVNGKTASVTDTEVKAAANVGTVIEAYVNDEDEIDNVVAYNYVLAVVDSADEYDSEDEMADKYGASVEYTLTDLDGSAYDDIVYVDTLSKDKSGTQAIGSYEEGEILAVVMTDTGKIIDKAIAGEVTGVMTAKGTGYIKVDGKQYTTVDAAKAPNFSDTYTYYTDPNGVIIDSEVYEEADAALEYVYVLKAEKETSSDSLLDGGEDRAVVKVMYADGTTAVVDYALTKTSDKDTYASGYYFKVGSDKYDLGAFNTHVTPGWYAYTTNSDDEITLKSANKADVSKVETTVKVEKNERQMTSTLYATSSTKVVVLNEDGIANTYTGYANFPSTAINKGALVVYGSSDKYAANVYIYDAAATTDTAKVDVALFVSAGDTTADGVVCTFYVDGEKVTYTVDADDEALGTAVAGQLFEIDVNEDVATLEALEKGTDYTYGTLKVVSDDYIVVDSADIDLAADCAVYQVSSNNKTVSTGTLAEDQKVVVFTNDDGAYLVFIYKNAPSAVTGE